MTDRTDVHTLIRDTLTAHGLIGTVSSITNGAHSRDVHLGFVTNGNRYAEQVSTLLGSTLDRRRYAVVGPEYGHHGLGRSVTVSLRSGSIMGTSGLLHREDSHEAHDAAHTISRQPVA